MSYTDVVELLTAWATQAPVPVSDACAQQSAELISRAIGRSDEPDLSEEERISTWLEALRLDWRNPLPAIRLVMECRLPFRQVTNIIFAAAKRAGAWGDEGSVEGMPPADRSFELRDQLYTLQLCALALDDAELFEQATKVRITAMRIDPSDGYYMCRNIVCYALMVGDLKTADRWIKVAKKKELQTSFWCWADVLLQRLKGSNDAYEAVRYALAHEPKVVPFLLGPPPPMSTLHSRPYRVGSEEEAQLHAGLMWNAWAAHPHDREWLHHATGISPPLRGAKGSAAI